MRCFDDTAFRISFGFGCTLNQNAGVRGGGNWSFQFGPQAIGPSFDEHAARLRRRGSDRLFCDIIPAKQAHLLRSPHMRFRKFGRTGRISRQGPYEGISRLLCDHWIFWSQSGANVNECASGDVRATLIISYSVLFREFCG